MWIRLVILTLVYIIKGGKPSFISIDLNVKICKLSETLLLHSGTLLSLSCLSCQSLSLSLLPLLFLHLSMLLLHLVHHLLDPEGLSFILILNLQLYLLLKISGWVFTVVKKFLLIFGVEIPEFFEIEIFDQFLSFVEVKYKFIDL